MRWIRSWALVLGALLEGFGPTHTYALFAAKAVSALRWHSLAGVPEPCV
jgi:hypothetical protein